MSLSVDIEKKLGAFHLRSQFEAPDETMALLGASGCGKSMTLKCIAGIVTPDRGRIVLGGRVLFDSEKKINLPPQQRRVGYLFQQYALFPNMSVEQNILCGIRSGDKAEKRRVLAEKIRMFRLEGLEKKHPAQLSGGQQQRVAIARALATNPKVLLCDEATSALDPNTTRSILELLREINKTLGVTIIVITHEMKVIDQICDRVAVIDKSCIAEEGRVADVFTNPKSDIARELVLPQERPVLDPTTGGRKLRLIFNGEDTQKPVISEMILACRVPVNVLFADTKSVEGAAYGHMILELPNDEHDAEKVVSWLKNSGLTWKEER